LCRKGILSIEDFEENLCDRELCLYPNVLQMILNLKDSCPVVSRYSKEEDLREGLAHLTRIMRIKSDELADIMRGYSNEWKFKSYDRRQRELLRQLDLVLRAKPAWNLSQARRTAFPVQSDWVIVLALMGKALSHVASDHDLFTGGGLVRATCSSSGEFSRCMTRLTADAPLIRQGYIQPCDGSGGLLSGNAESLKNTGFELTEKTLKLLGLEEACPVTEKPENALRNPRIQLADMILPALTMDSVRLALDHVRNSGKLMDQWGLRKTFPYGTGATMLFYGPPGTGKTATAEAIAHELGKPLYVADYSKIQNCFVGQTEKNIVATFRKAKQAGAVLFWDEADAMFTDRDSATRTYEVRDVNVLLQEVERFDGVCILTTNRKMTLDKALERRITAKVEFPRPDRHLREGIWRSLLPKDLPLGGDVDISHLAAMDLAGGEIKNVILNAARMACGRQSDDRVTAQDFERALEMETRDRWGETSRKRAGFRLD
jgi:AAA+ superfamily predicted ATPase